MACAAAEWLTASVSQLAPPELKLRGLVQCVVLRPLPQKFWCRNGRGGEHGLRLAFYETSLQLLEQYKCCMPDLAQPPDSTLNK